MIWYVAIVAALNLGLGYAWAVFFRPCPRCARARAMRTSWPTTDEREAVQKPIASSGSPISPRPLSQSAAATLSEESVATVATPETPVSQSADEDAPLDPVTGLVTREHAEKLLAQLSATDTQADPLTIALVEMGKADWNGDSPDQTLDERLLCGISTVVRQGLTVDQTAARYTDQQLLLLVSHEDVRQATRRTEEVRQRIASTEFVADGRTLQTTVTCALVEVTSAHDGPKLFEFLQEALDEAKRYGGNRTFMHDGNSPTPVVPPELKVLPQQLAI